MQNQAPPQAPPGAYPAGGHGGLERALDRFKETLVLFTIFLCDLSLDIAQTVARWLRMPLALLLASWIMWSLVSSVAITYAEHIHAVVLPVCKVPIVGYIIPGCYSPLDSIPLTHADFPALVDSQTSSLELLLEESVGTNAVGWDIRKAETVSRDLVYLVRNSKLLSREQIADALEVFVKQARDTGKSLRSFDSAVSLAVGSTIAANRHAYQTIVEHEARELSFVGMVHRLIFGDATSDVVEKSFEAAMDNHAMHLGNLLVQAQWALDLLCDLEKQLALIHDMCMRESLTLTDVREDLLAELWTILGGNQRKLRGVHHHLTLLGNIARYRTKALAHVLRAMQEVGYREELLQHLCTQAASAGIAAGTVPLKMQLESIKAGIERLEDRGEAAITEKKLAAGRALQVETFDGPTISGPTISVA